MWEMYIYTYAYSVNIRHLNFIKFKNKYFNLKNTDIIFSLKHPHIYTLNKAVYLHIMWYIYHKIKTYQTKLFLY